MSHVGAVRGQKVYEVTKRRQLVTGEAELNIAAGVVVLMNCGFQLAGYLVSYVGQAQRCMCQFTLSPNPLR